MAETPKDYLRSTTRLVAWSLSMYMSERGDSAYPGLDRLSGDTALSVRAVRDALKDLVEKGWLELVEQGGLKGARRRANHYRATIPATYPKRAHTPASPAGVAPDLGDDADDPAARQEKSPTPADDDTTPADDAGVPRQDVPSTPAGAASHESRNSPWENTSSSSGETRPSAAGRDDDDQGQANGGDPRLDGLEHDVAQATLRLQVEDGFRVARPGPWLATVARDVRDRPGFHADALALLDRCPGLTREELAEALARDDDQVEARYRARVRAACTQPGCRNGLVELDEGGVARCEDCNPEPADSAVWDELEAVG